MSEIDNTDDIAKRLPYVRPTLITISSKAADAAKTYPSGTEGSTYIPTLMKTTMYGPPS